MRKKEYAPILIIFLALIVISGAYYFGVKNGKLTPDSIQTPVLITPTTSPTTTPKTVVSITPVPTQNGVDLEHIRYTLPKDWKAEIRDGGLFFTKSGGGYLFIKVYNYSENTGRREYYCKIVNYCMQQTYFTEIKIGNISGYKASVLDNSGGDSDYFGAKGNKFYIVYGLTSNIQEIIDSLRF